MTIISIQLNSAENVWSDFRGKKEWIQSKPVTNLAWNITRAHCDGMMWALYKQFKHENLLLDTPFISEVLQRI